MARIALLALAAMGTVQALELTAENWEEKTAGKTVLVKFLAPWWGHCKSMKPDWDKLMASYKDHATTLIADVDCTAGGESLCQEIGVEGYPTIKFGDPSSLEDYDGGRDLKSLKKFAKGLGPMCSPQNIDICDADKKAQIQKFMAMSQADRDAEIAEKDAESKTIDADFNAFVEGLQKQYEEAEKKKTAELKAIKDSGLGLLKAVNKHVQKTATAGSSEL